LNSTTVKLTKFVMTTSIISYGNATAVTKNIKTPNSGGHMSNNTHTPGPWRTGDVFNTVFGPPNGNPSPAIVATVNKANKANARLIAAAPEMLEALTRAAPWLGKLIANNVHMDCVMPNDAIRTLDMIEAAIAKAKGL
jgi:hypothetical protein